MTTRIYIAGAWVEQDLRARPMIARVKEAGLQVTVDWTRTPEERDSLPGSDAGLTAPDRATYATQDLMGVTTADVFWLLAAEDKGSCGSWVELGAALTRRASAWRPIIIVSGAKWKRSIFTELADMKFDSDAGALEAVLTLHAARETMRQWGKIR